MAGPNIVMRIQVRGSALSTGEARVKTIYNVYDWKRTTTTGTPSKSQFQAAFKTAILTPLAACLSVSYVKAYTDTRWLDDPTDAYLVQTDGVNGTVTGDSLPSVNNVSMQLKSGLRGRNYRGAKRFGPIAESHTTLDYLTGAAIALWATFQAAYLAGFTDAGGYVWLPHIVSQQKSVFTKTTATVSSKQCTTTIVNAYLGIMRKRSQERVNTM